MKQILSIVSVFLICGLVESQWGSRGCAQPSISSVEEYTWRPLIDDPSRIYLYRGQTQLGGWDYEQKYWQSYSAMGWGPKEPKAPIEPPLRNCGVEWNKIGNKITFNGKEITQQEANKAITNNIPDDSTKFNVTVVGSETQRKDFLILWETLEADIKDKCKLWCCTPDHWSVKDFKTPSIYCQAPDGKVLHRQDDFNEPLSAIRKAVKGYDPAKDPDLRKPSPTPTLPDFNWFWILVGGLGLLVFSKYKGKI